MNEVADHEAVVDPGIYSREYFLADNEGWREYAGDLDNSMHPKFARALELTAPTGKDNVLDIGCGRGEMLYYAAKRGARVLGLDYSRAAVEISRQTVSRLPPGLRPNVRVELGDPSNFALKDKYTIIYIIETLEHMHDWQIRKMLLNIGGALDADGRMIILTPNYYYEKYLSPLKRLVNLPLNLIKFPFRLLKKKYQVSGYRSLLKKAFRIYADRGERNRLMHVNVTTISKIRELLKDFDVSVRCEDSSMNVFAIIMKRWWGRDIVAVARPKRACQKNS